MTMTAKEVAEYVGSSNRNFAVQIGRRDPTFPRALPSPSVTAVKHFVRAEVEAWAKTYVISENKGRGVTAAKQRGTAQTKREVARLSRCSLGIARERREPLMMTQYEPVVYKALPGRRAYRVEIRPREPQPGDYRWREW